MIAIDNEPVTKDYIEQKRAQINNTIKKCNIVYGAIGVLILILNVVFWFAIDLSIPEPMSADVESCANIMLSFFFLFFPEMIIFCGWTDCTDAHELKRSLWSFVEKKDCIKLLNIGKKRVEIQGYLKAVAAMDRLPTKEEFNFLVDYDHTYDIKKQLAERKAAEKAAADKACVLILAGEI